MAARGTIAGALGQVKHAYQTAAIVTGYTISKDDLTDTWMLTGTVAQSDAFLLRQAPLVFVMKAGAWRWPVTAWAMADGKCQARLGPLQGS